MGGFLILYTRGCFNQVLNYSRMFTINLGIKTRQLFDLSSIAVHWSILSNSPFAVTDLVWHQQCFWSDKNLTIYKNNWVMLSALCFGNSRFLFTSLINGNTDVKESSSRRKRLRRRSGKQANLSDQIERHSRHGQIISCIDIIKPQ